MNVTRPIGPADKALLAAEQEVAALRQTEAALAAAGDRGDHEELFGQILALDAFIAKLEPDSLIGAAVKLRRLAFDEDAETGADEGAPRSIHQILTVIERSIAPAAASGAAAASQPVAGAEEEAKIAALVEKRFRLAEQAGEVTRGLGLDDGTIDRIFDAMIAAVDALDQRIVDRIPETPADLSAQLRLFRAFHLDGPGGWSDERDERLYRSIMAGLAGLRIEGEGAG